MEETDNIVINRKILVVEDDKFLNDLLVKKLLREGFNVKSSFDSIGAFSILTEEKPNIILLDLILPVVDGFEILEIIKSDINTSSIPVLILSNHGQEEDIARVMSLGAHDFLVKVNFTLDEIILKVKDVLDEIY